MSTKNKKKSSLSKYVATDKDLTITKKETCPECGSLDVLEIVYGCPGPELVKDFDAGKVWLGGCIRSAGDPRLYCQDCGEEFGNVPTITLPGD